MHFETFALSTDEQHALDRRYLVELLGDIDEKLLDDALAFFGCVRDFPKCRDIWSDVGEVGFEWIAEGRHAFASIEGDGLIGYSMLVGDNFVSGEVDDAEVSSLPGDLERYLADFRGAGIDLPATPLPQKAALI